MTLIDVVIVMTIVEGILLTLIHRRTGRGIAPIEFWPNLASGLALMGAVRAAMGGLSWGWVAAGLSAAGLLHAADLRRRWR